MDFCLLKLKINFWTSGPSEHNLPSGRDLQRERWRRGAKEHLCQGARPKQFSNNMNIIFNKKEHLCQGALETVF